MYSSVSIGKKKKTNTTANNPKLTVSLFRLFSPLSEWEGRKYILFLNVKYKNFLKIS